VRGDKNEQRAQDEKIRLMEMRRGMNSSLSESVGVSVGVTQADSADSQGE
jgi:hypothetical protein